MSEPHEPDRMPNLEDLLRLKRAERPDAAFWHAFEAGLRRKQLAAIIEPRPWWLAVSLLARRVSAPVWAASALSAGAAALVAVASLRTTASAPQPQPAFASPVAITPAFESTDGRTMPAKLAERNSVPPQTPTFAPAEMRSASGNTELPAPNLAHLEELPINPTGVAPSGPRSTVWHQTAEMLEAGITIATLALPEPRLGVDSKSKRDAQSGAATPSYRAENVEEAPISLAELIAAHFDLRSWDFTASAPASVPRWDTRTNAPMAEPALGLSEAHSFQSELTLVAFAEPAIANTALAEPEAPEIDTATLAPRHARLLAVALPADQEIEPVARAKDRIVRHLAAEDQLYAAATRVGVGGDRLSLRF